MQSVKLKVENIKAFRNSLIVDMKKVFGTDHKRIDHAIAVLNYAEQILEAEGGDSHIVIAAAILHDIGIHEAEKKYNSASGKYQEIEGPPIAKDILLNYELAKSSIAHVCKIIANHHSAKDIDTPEFRIVWDADWLVNIPDEYLNADKEKLQELVKKVFKTNRGQQIAKELFILPKNEESICR